MNSTQIANTRSNNNREEQEKYTKKKIHEKIGCQEELHSDFSLKLNGERY